MTLIVSPKVFTSKAALKAALDQGQVEVEDPSIFAPWIKPAADIPVGWSGVVTNHPKRTKFARIVRKTDGTWAVS